MHVECPCDEKNVAVLWLYQKTHGTVDIVGTLFKYINKGNCVKCAKSVTTKFEISNY